MGEGLPLPWPFPWSTRAELMGQICALSDDLGARSVRKKPGGQSTLDLVKEAADIALAEFSRRLPAVTSSELHLIRGLVSVVVDGKETVAVKYAPEFLYVLDVGLEARVGASFGWDNLGAGDPTFPDIPKVNWRSVVGHEDTDLIFPFSSGKLLIGIHDGVADTEVRAELERQGLKDIENLGFLAIGRCAPFYEKEIAAQLKAKLAFVRYVSLNQVLRDIEFSPGWTATQLL